MNVICFIINLLFQSLRNEIEKVQEREMSLDDLDAEDSSYIYEDRLKKKFKAAWAKLCEITERTVTTGRPTERSIKYQGVLTHSFVFLLTFTKKIWFLRGSANIIFYLLKYTKGFGFQLLDIFISFKLQYLHKGFLLMIWY